MPFVQTANLLLQGPCIGGVIVTFTDWRIIFWVQVGMAGMGLISAVITLPKFRNPGDETDGSGGRLVCPAPLEIVSMFNPLNILRMLLYPNVLLAVSVTVHSSIGYTLNTQPQQVTCGLLAWFQYSILTSVRSVFNPRFHLTTALVSGLFYLAPGGGFLFGSIIGGKLSDQTVRRYIQKRNGVRIPQDRLNSGLITLFAVLPVSTLIYGWTLQEEVGGMAVPVIFAFTAGFGKYSGNFFFFFFFFFGLLINSGLMGSFNGLNTYTAGESFPFSVFF